jgi:hypothetical protein
MLWSKANSPARGSREPHANPSINGFRRSGLPDHADAMEIAQGDPADLRLVAVFGRESRTIAALSFDSARWLPAYRAFLKPG